MDVKYLQQHPQFNFQLKFLKFKKWRLDGYKIMRVMNIHLKKKKAMKKASEVPAGLGTDTGMVGVGQ